MAVSKSLASKSLASESLSSESFSSESIASEYLASEYLVLLPKGHTKQRVRQFCCTLCKSICNNVKEHLDSYKHLRLANVQDILLQLQQHGIDWKDKSKKSMHCFFCSINLSIECSNLLQHAMKHACTISEPANP